MKLFVDYRERHLSRLLEEVCEELVFTHLLIGDYLFVSDSNTVIVERKTVNDFLGSVRNGRLWDQLLRMMKAEHVLDHPVKRRVLLLHGNFKDYFESVYLRIPENEYDVSLRWSQLMGAFQEIVYCYNTPIFHAEDDLAFKAFIRILTKREISGSNDKLPKATWYRRPKKSDLPVKDLKKFVLSSFPGVGDQLAENLLLHFNTIQGIACASIEELRKVPKIGKKKAYLINKLFQS